MADAIADEHPELFHYTGIDGLEGIVRTQTLRATHAAFLNDASEIRSFNKELPNILRPAIETGVAELVRNFPANRVEFERYGGIAKAIDEIVRIIPIGMYEALLGSKESSPFLEPYITSFCTAKNGIISQHGLLSQWRGYGQQGGYAIVFDTSKLDLLLEDEGRKWGHDLFGGDVIYSDKNEKIQMELGENIEVIKSNIVNWLGSGGSPDALEKTYEAFIQCACRYKHWGFHEEKEVRFISLLPNKELLELQIAHGEKVKEKPRHHFMRAGAAIPCIYLFDEIARLPDRPLPITRIIIGPNRDQDSRRRALELLLAHYRLDICVTASEIPYSG